MKVKKKEKKNLVIEVNVIIYPIVHCPNDGNMKLENEKSFRFFHFPSHRQRVNTTREHVNGCVNIFLLKKRK